ncbi:DUF928 domain-containing protein [Leptothermofonsia sichuanensis E412]|uniref:DUF928 domain-containing protein n=1 Tax=Leptothermofonsia sichuanensis TaxID=2917832 RepID=UPI001CA75C4A|nr:DUF928 domain-containing protein [Leptothermofonsia sichuanensis]QZZ18698.1 DUF928 domain-containing protein [Leptothermofonsia sichuanensis E412]
MLRNKSLLFSLSISVGLLISGIPLLAMAQQYRPPSRGIPGRREGAGTRGTCMTGQKFLMPLTPVNGFSATVSSQPTFFWYVPPSSARTAEFALLDGNDRALYKTTIALPETPGIVSYTVPETVASTVLEVSKDFYWQFTILCDPTSAWRNPFVEGVVQRLQPTPDLTRQLKQARSVYDRASVYASSGLWHDAIALLAQEQCARPDDASARVHWKTLLKSVQLEEFAAEPLTAACSAMIQE